MALRAIGPRWWLGLVAAAAVAAGGADAVLRYEGVTPDGGLFSLAEHRWRREADGWSVTVRWHSPVLGRGGEERLDMDAAGGLRQSALYLGPETVYRLHREGDRLRIEGRLQGRAVARGLALDPVPLCTNPTVCLRPFVLGGARRAAFQILHPETLELYGMAVRRAETVERDGRRRVRVHWRLAGWRGLFYRRDYWFDADSGVFLEGAADDGVQLRLRSPP